jgi:hypothetical protein
MNNDVTANTWYMQIIIIIIIITTTMISISYSYDIAQICL